VVQRRGKRDGAGSGSEEWFRGVVQCGGVAVVVGVRRGTWCGEMVIRKMGVMGGGVV
jgi:hypothetical protein